MKFRGQGGIEHFAISSGMVGGGIAMKMLPVVGYGITYYAMV